MPISTKNSNTSKDKEKRPNIKALNEKYTQRITLARQGNVAAKAGDVRNAIKYYNMYLKILAEVKEVADVNSLAPHLFNIEKELSELLLISHIYWDLCKMYDVSPHLESEFNRTLNKFVDFTQGFKYQIINAEMLRKFIKRDRHVHKREFKEAYKRIYMSSKNCYIATMCYGENHLVTHQFRKFKNYLSIYSFGRSFIDFYYFFSPGLVQLCSKYKVLNFIATRVIFRPILFLIYLLINFICFIFKLLNTV